MPTSSSSIPEIQICSRCINWWSLKCKKDKATPCLNKYHAVKMYKGKGKSKVVPVLFFTEHHTMKAIGGVEEQLQPFFDLGTRRR